MRRPSKSVGLALGWAISLLFPIVPLSAQAALHVASVAQPAPPLADTTRWRFVLTPYGWLSGLNGNIGVGPVTTRVDFSPRNVLDMLKFGAMVSGEARHGPWVVVADAVYASLGNGAALAVRGDTGTFSYSQKEAIVQPAVGYTIGNGDWAVDGLLGARYWYLGANLDVDRTQRPATTERADSREWVDMTGGGRLRWSPARFVHFVGGADVGGGGSRRSWQAYGSAGVEPWYKLTLGIGYRILDVDYDRNAFLYDTRSSGFTFGATFRL